MARYRTSSEKCSKLPFRQSSFRHALPLPPSELGSGTCQTLADVWKPSLWRTVRNPLSALTRLYQFPPRHFHILPVSLAQATETMPNTSILLLLAAASISQATPANPLSYPVRLSATTPGNASIRRSPATPSSARKRTEGSTDRVPSHGPKS